MILNFNICNSFSDSKENNEEEISWIETIKLTEEQQRELSRADISRTQMNNRNSRPPTIYNGSVVNGVDKAPQRPNAVRHF